MLVTSEDGSWSGHLALTNYSLAARIPVPEQHRAVLAATDNVAVTGVVALRPDNINVTLIL